MENQKIPTYLGIIVVIIVAITVSAFMWKYKRIKQQEGMQEPNVSVQPKTDKDNQKKLEEQPILEKSKEDWKIYQDKKYSIEFKYPNKYLVEAKDFTLSTDYYIKEANDIIINVKVVDWKNFVIEEHTPGAFWQKLGYNNWKYFVDNFKRIQEGECDNETIIHVPGPTIAEKPKECVATKYEDYIKINTETSIIYYTKTLQISWESSLQNFNLIKKITDTLKIN